MKLRVSDIVGLPGLPATNRGVRDWLQRQGTPLDLTGNRFSFAQTDLQKPVQPAYQGLAIEAVGLPMGQRDDAMRMAFEAKPLGVQQTGHFRTDLLLFVTKCRAVGMKLP